MRGDRSGGMRGYDLNEHYRERLDRDSDFGSQRQSRKSRNDDSSQRRYENLSNDNPETQASE